MKHLSCRFNDVILLYLRSTESIVSKFPALSLIGSINTCSTLHMMSIFFGTWEIFFFRCFLLRFIIIRSISSRHWSRNMNRLHAGEVHKPQKLLFLYLLTVQLHEGFSSLRMRAMLENEVHISTSFYRTMLCIYLHKRFIKISHQPS